MRQMNAVLSIKRILANINLLFFFFGGGRGGGGLFMCHRFWCSFSREANLRFVSPKLALVIVLAGNGINSATSLIFRDRVFYCLR